ncbi:hypothetical protein ACTHQF_04695 [Pedobacter sp. SAFR-022]|uniref:hypothetical protein n=1 Tax=Pedobacter sp. SAFR-022 TaxID=3436861 RepID=UPI003F7F5463
MLNFKTLIYFLAVGLVISACNSTPEKNAKKEKKKKEDIKRLDFTPIVGIKYHEVTRRFSNGLSFSDIGFQQEPSWIIQFASNDTVKAWSPQKQIMQSFYFMYDHGDVYNFAGEWFRIKGFSKDSIRMQRLQLTNRVIEKDIRSDVFMTYYSEDYLKKINKTPEELRKPTAADTAFIRKLVARADRNPANADSAFAGRIPVQFTPKSKIISVKKLSTVDRLVGRTESYDYLFPEYRIKIEKAYQDFGYSFTAVVDKHGKIYLNSFRDDMPEYHEQRKKVLEGIIDVYLQNLLIVKPGSTLGIPHSSEITLNVSGKK